MLENKLTAAMSQFVGLPWQIMYSDFDRKFSVQFRFQERLHMTTPLSASPDCLEESVAKAIAQVEFVLNQ